MYEGLIFTESVECFIQQKTDLLLFWLHGSYCPSKVNCWVLVVNLDGLIEFDFFFQWVDEKVFFIWRDDFSGTFWLLFFCL